MKAKEMIELIQQHHPHLGEVEINKLLNRAKDDFCAKTEMVKKSITDTSVANQRYYNIDTSVIRIEDLWINDVLVPRLIGKPKIDDDTSESEA